MKRLLATLVCISALSSVFGQDYQLGTGVSKTNNSIPVVYQVRNSGTEGAGVLLLSANDSIAIIAKGDTLSLAHPDTAVDFFLLTEGDILNRGDYKYWDGDSWELFTGGGAVSAPLYIEVGNGLTFRLDSVHDVLIGTDSESYNLSGWTSYNYDSTNVFIVGSSVEKWDSSGAFIVSYRNYSYDTSATFLEVGARGFGYSSLSNYDDRLYSFSLDFGVSSRIASLEGNTLSIFTHQDTSVSIYGADFLIADRQWQDTVFYVSQDNQIRIGDEANVGYLLTADTNGYATWQPPSGGGNTLNAAYNQGGSGAGREIIADSGAVWVSGEDGFIVTGTFGSGDTSQWVGGGPQEAVMFFNPNKAAFRAGTVYGTEWDNSNIGDYSIAMGHGTTASGDYSVAMGANSRATGITSFCIGDNCESAGAKSATMGIGSVSSGVASLATGVGTLSKSYAETAIGLYCTDYLQTDSTQWSATDRLFVIGNGTNDINRSDAIVILKDGSTTLNGSLEVVTTTGAFTPPILSAAQIAALTPTAGMMIYNSDTNKHQGYDGTSWNNLY